jgi:TPR repeat protein
VNVSRASFAVRPVPAPEALAIRAALLQAMREPAPAARTLAESALQADPKLALAHEVLGRIADSEGRPGDAREAFARAVDNGSQSYFAHYRLAQLLWKTDADRPTLERMAAVLEKASELNPDDPWSLSFLADTRVDLEKADTALEPARKAVQLAPGEAHHRQALARVLGNMGRIDEAQQEAGRGLALAKDDKSRAYSREQMVWLARLRDHAASTAAAPATAEETSAPVASETAEAVPAETSKAPAQGASKQGARSGQPMRHPCAAGDAKGCRDWLAAAETACAGGSIDACTSAGSAYTGAPGVTPDPAKAIRMLEKACAGKSQDGCVNLAVNLVNNGRAEDRTRALDLLAKACAAGHQPACGLRTQIESMRR